VEVARLKALKVLKLNGNQLEGECIAGGAFPPADHPQFEISRSPPIWDCADLPSRISRLVQLEFRDLSMGRWFALLSLFWFVFEYGGTIGSRYIQGRRKCPPLRRKCLPPSFTYAKFRKRSRTASLHTLIFRPNFNFSRFRCDCFRALPFVFTFHNPGEIPAELGGLSALVSLWLNDNQFEGGCDRCLSPPVRAPGYHRTVRHRNDCSPNPSWSWYTSAWPHAKSESFSRLDNTKLDVVPEFFDRFLLMHPLVKPMSHHCIGNADFSVSRYLR